MAAANKTAFWVMVLLIVPPVQHVVYAQETPAQAELLDYLGFGYSDIQEQEYRFETIYPNGSVDTLSQLVASERTGTDIRQVGLVGPLPDGSESSYVQTLTVQPDGLYQASLILDGQDYTPTPVAPFLPWPIEQGEVREVVTFNSYQGTYTARAEIVRIGFEFGNAFIHAGPCVEVVYSETSEGWPTVGYDTSYIFCSGFGVVRRSTTLDEYRQIAELQAIENIAQPEPPVEPETMPSEPVDMTVFFIAEGAPDPLLCVLDEDCMSGTIACAEATEGLLFCEVGSAGCCVGDSTPIAQSRAYSQWSDQWREAHCADITCPIFGPSPPRECELSVACVDGVCQNSCVDE